MSADSDDGDDPPRGERKKPYKIGYKQPPLNTRFRKGQSGNPNGRPKGARNRPVPATRDDLRAIFLKEAYREVPVHDANGIVTVSMVEAVSRSMAVNAAKGNVRAQQAFLERVDRIEKEKDEERKATASVLMEYAVKWELEYKHYEAQGIKVLVPLVHPSDMDIDPVTGKLRIQPPLTLKHDRTEWEAACDELEQKLKNLTARREQLHGAAKAKITAEIAEIEKRLSLIRAALEGWREAIGALNKAMDVLSRKGLPKNKRA